MCSDSRQRVMQKPMNHPAINLLIDERRLETILSSADIDEDVEPDKFVEGVFHLKALYSIFVSERARQSRNFRSAGDRQLKVLEHNARVICQFLRGDQSLEDGVAEERKTANLKTLLEATTFDLNLHLRDGEQRIDSWRLFEELENNLQDLNRLIEHYRRRSVKKLGSGTADPSAPQRRHPKAEPQAATTRAV